MVEFKIKTRELAFLAVFSAVSGIIAEFVPGIPVIGVSGARIKFDAAIAPLWGMILGPNLGFLSGLIGGLIASNVKPLSVLTSFCTAISAFVAGALTQEYYKIGNFKVKGWILGLLVEGILILGWYATSVGRGAPYYPILQFVGFLIPLMFRGTISKLYNKGGKTILLSIVLASYSGIVADHMLGNLIFISMFPDLLTPQIFMMVLPISIVERALLTIIASVVGFTLILSLYRTGLYPKRGQTIESTSTQH